ncbi:WXG100 family type VII secretion target [Streptomyces sp. TLI_171]|uniref:WXG100 family type VII secretion target n=1 Tax=Streptomyces sp. TLI_171 TaxID=1938859 RepID=UPI0016001764|nr:WXG100 family type VII secretion target [Streptomyces sp. TLI_171]
MIANAMQQAIGGITSVKNQADSGASTLASSYRGADGAAFQQLLSQWDGYIQKVLAGLSEVENTMHAQSTATNQQSEARLDDIKSLQARTAYAGLT